MNAYGVEDGGTFKKFSHKKDITQDLYYNIYCGNVVEMIHIFCQQRNTYYWLLTYHTDFVGLINIRWWTIYVQTTWEDGDTFRTVNDNILMENAVFHSMCHGPKLLCGTSLEISLPWDRKPCLVRNIYLTWGILICPSIHST